MADENETTETAEQETIAPRRGRPPKAAGNVTIRITKFGHHQISSGEHIAGHGDRMLPAGATLSVSQETSDALEARGFAEIQ